jgi:16S rRNA processing protein RimM
MNTGKKNDLVLLGNCHKPHGIRGEFSFFLENMHDSVLKKGSEITLFPKNPSSSIKTDGEVFKIEKISFGNKAIARLVGVVDRNQVEAMVPFEIFVDRKELPEPDEDEVYLSDLIGLKVLEQGTDRELGKVTKFFDNGAQVVLTIRGHKSFDIPFVKHFVPEIDVAAGVMWVNVPQVV